MSVLRKLLTQILRTMTDQQTPDARELLEANREVAYARVVMENWGMSDANLLHFQNDGNYITHIKTANKSQARVLFNQLFFDRDFAGWRVRKDTLDTYTLYRVFEPEELKVDQSTALTETWGE